MRIAQCPADQTPLGVVPESDEFEGTCEECGQTFRLLFGTVARTNSRQEQAPNSMNWRRLYEIWVERANGREEVVRFFLPGREVKVLLEKGDPITYCVRMPGYRPVYLHNRATHATWWISPAAPMKTRRTGPKLVGMAFLAFAAFYLFQAIAALAVEPILGAAIMGVIGGAILWGERPERRPALPANPLRPILEELMRVDGRLDELEREEVRLRDARAKLVDLTRDMRDVGEAVYGARIEKMQRAVRLIDDQFAGDAVLREAYETTRKMLHIEVKTVQTAEAVQSSLALVNRRQDEVKQIEFENANRRIELEAIDEVERILA